MKKLLILLAAVALPMLAGAQAQINTKKAKVGDFTEKVTKVVLSGSGFEDMILKELISARWRISPYEFCTPEEFETLKSSDQYYFLIPVAEQFKKETAPGIKFLTLIKGGAGSEKGIGGMLEVVSVPYASVEEPSGREFVFLPALIDVLQDHTLASMENDLSAYGGLGSHTSNISKSEEMSIVFTVNDFSGDVDGNLIKEKFDEKMRIEDEEKADQYMIDHAPRTLISYVVAPTYPTGGSYCYKMLIDAETHKLYYFRRHRISKKAGVGFLPEDITKISTSRKQKSNK